MADIVCIFVKMSKYMIRYWQIHAPYVPCTINDYVWFTGRGNASKKKKNSIVKKFTTAII